MKALLTFAPLVARLRSAFALTLGLSLLTLFAGIALLGLSGWFLTAAALSTAGAAFSLFAPSAGVRGLSFLRILSRYGEKLAGHDATLRLLSDLRVWLFSRLFPLVPLGRRLGRGDLVNRLLADVEALDTLFLMALGPISTAVLAGGAMTIVLAIFLPAAALHFALFFFSAALLVPIGLVLVARRTGTEIVAATSLLRQSILDGVEGHEDYVLYGATDIAASRVATPAARVASARRRLGLIAAGSAGLVQVLAGAALVSVLSSGLSALDAGAIDGPLLAGLLLAVLGSFEASAMLVRSATRLAGAAAAAERLHTLATATPSVSDPTTPQPLPPGSAVRFEGVRFGYDPNRPVIGPIDLTIEAGHCIAITGPSGAGKSTIAHLLVRLADPDAGTVRVAGRDIRQVPSELLRTRVALMTQDAPVFLDTIRANLLIGRHDASDADCWRVLEAVRLSEFVRGLPQGLDTVVGEAGRTLSAGQARRIGLARTLLSRAAIIVLDEPTSGLDHEAEAAFLGELPEMLRGRTAIVITHAEVPTAFDRVYAMEAGRLVEGPRRGA